MKKRDNYCRHIAIIMDGNGRWAKKNRFNRALGHREGVKAVKRIVKAAQLEKLDALTIYAFSTENWKRPHDEVSFLMELLFKTLENELEELHQEEVKISIIGDLEALPERLQQKLKESIDRTKNNRGLALNIAINYGARAEIVAMTKSIASAVKDGALALDEIDESYLNQHLALNDQPPVDLLIRTSGEQRLSNFLLWQLAYTELYFTERHWPEFTHDDLKHALEDFNNRERRFGGIKER